MQIHGTKFTYTIDTGFQDLFQYGDGFIARGTESIVYKGLRAAESIANENIRMSCVLKFKRRGTNDRILKRFKGKDLKIFNDLQGCRSVVRIYDLIEDIGDFSIKFEHVAEGEEPFDIDRHGFFCVVEEYIEGKTLEEFCLEYGEFPLVVRTKLAVTGYSDFSEENKARTEKYVTDNDFCLRFQSVIYNFAVKLCDVLDYMHRNRILHMDIKPDNIMITNAGDEVVLIDFGRANYMDQGKDYVTVPFGGENVSEYGTVGYAAPEAYNLEMKPQANFTSANLNGDLKNACRLTVESDIFSLGATLWECMNIFSLYMNNIEYRKKFSNGYHYQRFFDTEMMLNEDAYCNRDLSLASVHFYDKLEQIIIKATRSRTPDYFDRDNKNYYHDYATLRSDIMDARERSPAVLRTDDIKVRNSFSVSAVFLGLLTTLLCFLGFLYYFGGHFAAHKIDNIMDNYQISKHESLKRAAEEQMRATGVEGRKAIYDKIYDFYYNENDGSDINGISEEEAEDLVQLLDQVPDEEFSRRSFDELLSNTDRQVLLMFSEYVSAADLDIKEDSECIGYELLEKIYESKQPRYAGECYKTLVKYGEKEEYRNLLVYLAKQLNTDQKIDKIVESKGSDEPSAIVRRSVKDYLDSFEE
ncbi:MAG: serine/threonine protein kinase [Ruminococcus albus]|nr:serine/threonine protein kinase [Ruminococcus albus]